MDPFDCATYAARCAARQAADMERARMVALAAVAVMLAAASGRLAAHGWHALAARAGLQREAVRGWLAYAFTFGAVLAAFAAGSILGAIR